MMRLLLINPKFPESFWSNSWIFSKIRFDKKSLNPPLGLATVAALTPHHWDVQIIDENVESIDWDAEADIVGVCGMQIQFERQKEILAYYRNKGRYVVAGGSYASLCPEEYSELADTVIAGEAEYIWPQFCSDFERAKQRELYQETGEVCLEDSPPPRYDLIRTALYDQVSIQFSRGCPFRCEFCDIIVMFGRKPRTKSLQQVERELDLLRSLGIRGVFFVDDNLIGHLPKAKKLLAFMAEYQQRHDYQFNLGAEASLNMAAHPDLLKLLRRANFTWVFIGIESPSEESLRETKKEQNTRSDMLASIRTIYAHGIDIFAGFIVGFDSDDKNIFDQQYSFIIESGIIVAMIGLLVALPRTPLFERLEKEHRLQPFGILTNTGTSTNIVPLKMRYDELINGYIGLQRRLLAEKAIYERIKHKIDYLGETPALPEVSIRRRINYGVRLVYYGVIRGGYRRWYYFVRSLLVGLVRPSAIAAIITNWALAISLRDFAERSFSDGQHPDFRVETT